MGQYGGCLSFEPVPVNVLLFQFPESPTRKVEIAMTRILVADDHQIVRAGLKNLLSEYKEFTVAGEAGSGTDALRMVREADWDFVLLDISMPDMNGIDTLQQIKRSKPDLPVPILTMQPADQY